MCQSTNINDNDSGDCLSENSLVVRECHLSPSTWGTNRCNWFSLVVECKYCRLIIFIVSCSTSHDNLTTKFYWCAFLEPTLVHVLINVSSIPNVPLWCDPLPWSMCSLSWPLILREHRSLNRHLTGYIDPPPFHVHF